MFSYTTSCYIYHTCLFQTSSREVDMDAVRGDNSVMEASITDRPASEATDSRQDNSVLTVHTDRLVAHPPSADVYLTLDEAGVLQADVDALWQQVERLMTQQRESVVKVLDDYGVGEGDEDSESEEGQLWSFVEGNTEPLRDTALVWHLAKPQQSFILLATQSL